MADLLSWAPKPLRRSVMWLVAALIIGYLLVPQIGGVRQSLELLGNVDPWFIALGTVLQVGAMLAQAELTRSVLPATHRPGFGDMVRIELSSTAVSHTVPGGTAAGTALGYRLMTRSGVPGPDAAFAVSVRGLGSALVLNALLWMALMISIPTTGFDPVYTTAAVVALLLGGAFAALVLLLLQERPGTERLVRRVAAALPFLDEERVPEILRHLAERLRELGRDRGVLVRATGWSAAYWLGQAVALWVFLAAFGYSADPVSLMVAFGVANVVGVIPVTPRGLGVLEATLIPLLVGFGAGRTQATLATLAWRFVGFWLPIPAGGLAYLSLRAVPPTATPEEEPASERLRELGQSAVDDAQRVGDWARERGLRLPTKGDAD
jgi:uncharacterized protein (TIRG00374 family)